MAQFDLYRLRGGQLVVDLQTGLIGIDASRIVAPLRDAGRLRSSLASRHRLKLMELRKSSGCKNWRQFRERSCESPLGPLRAITMC